MVVQGTLRAPPPGTRCDSASRSADRMHRDRIRSYTRRAPNQEGRAHLSVGAAVLLPVRARLLAFRAVPSPMKCEPSEGVRPCVCLRVRVHALPGRGCARTCSTGYWRAPLPQVWSALYVCPPVSDAAGHLPGHCSWRSCSCLCGGVPPCVAAFGGVALLGRGCRAPERRPARRVEPWLGHLLAGSDDGVRPFCVCGAEKSRGHSGQWPATATSELRGCGPHGRSDGSVGIFPPICHTAAACGWRPA